MAIGVLGAGNFAMSTLLPAIKRLRGVDLVSVCAANGSHARHAAEKFGFRYCATEEQRILHDPDVNTVVIATRHHLHATQVLAALAAGKHVFCEKPLCLNEIDFAEIVRAYASRISAAIPADGWFQPPIRSHGSKDESVSQAGARAVGVALPRQRRFHSRAITG